MGSSLFNFLNNKQANSLFANPTELIKQINNLKSQLGSNPEQIAEQNVKKMLDSGKLSQTQFEKAGQMATMIQNNDWELLLKTLF